MKVIKFKLGGLILDLLFVAILLMWGLFSDISQFYFWAGIFILVFKITFDLFRKL